MRNGAALLLSILWLPAQLIIYDIQTPNTTYQRLIILGARHRGNCNIAYQIPYPRTQANHAKL